MLGSAVLYLGLIVAVFGLVLLIWPAKHLGVPQRFTATSVVVAGLGLVVIGFAFPAPTSRATRVESRLDQWMPSWQFSESHTIRVAAPPPRVYEAIKLVRADEIFLFNALTWIRRAGRPLPESILNAGNRKSLIDLATQSGFVRLADDPPRELVIGTAVAVPPGTRGTLTPDAFKKRLPPGFALATMNFRVTPDGNAGSRVTTETRVFANSPATRRRFAKYWRVIYPGSAIIRRMWLRAVRRRAELASSSH